MKQTILSLLLLILSCNALVGAKRGKSPSCKDFAQIGSIDHRIAALFGNLPYYEQDCRKLVNIDSEVQALLSSVQGASSVEIKLRTAPLMGSRFESAARGLVAAARHKELVALFEDMKARPASSDEWTKRMPEFAGTTLTRSVDAEHRRALLRELRRGASLAKILKYTGIFDGTDLGGDHRALAFEAAQRGLAEERDMAAVEQACSILRRQFADACDKRIAEIRGEKLIREIRERGGSLADWLNAQKSVTGAQAAEVDREIDSAIKRLDSMEDVHAVCEQIGTDAVKGRCQSRAQALADHLVRSAPTEDNLRRAAAVCQGPPCDNTIRGYEFGLRLVPTLEEMVASRPDDVADEVARSKPFWLRLESDLMPL